MHEVTITIRWRDIDDYGHVNNAVYLTYLEEARDRLIEGLFHTQAWDFVLARIEIDYRSSLTQGDGTVTVRSQIESFGNASVRTRERIGRADGSLAAEAKAVIVPRDPQEARSRALTTAEREILQAEVDAG
jgi:acyl-CoA thioester hydrolase